jgi:aminoglycoside phosphotransferase (APT) family kinase protein
LQQALAHAAGDAARVIVERVEDWGGGLSRDAFAAHVDITPDPSALSGPYVALLANRDADRDYPERVRREASVLEWIAPRIRDLRVPRAIALLDAPSAPILVESFITGIEPDFRFGMMRIVPWEIVAAAAAAVHAVEHPPFLPARDRRQHRLDLLDDLFPELDILPAVLRDARAWMREHADRPGPGVLLHGDLLHRNFRLHPSDPLGLLDWEYSELGDPAHDLAIVTRGNAKPFQAPDSRAKLLAAYNARSPHEVTRDDLRFFELALLVGWFNESVPDRAEHLAKIARYVPRA